MYISYYMIGKIGGKLHVNDKSILEYDVGLNIEYGN